MLLEESDILRKILFKSCLVLTNTTLSDLAKGLEVTPAAIRMVVEGKGQSKKIDSFVNSFIRRTVLDTGLSIKITNYPKLTFNTRAAGKESV